jgi:hypothetical protein
VAIKGSLIRGNGSQKSKRRFHTDGKPPPTTYKGLKYSLICEIRTSSIRVRLATSQFLMTSQKGGKGRSFDSRLLSLTRSRDLTYRHGRRPSEPRHTRGGQRDRCDEDWETIDGWVERGRDR